MKEEVESSSILLAKRLANRVGRPFGINPPRYLPALTRSIARQTKTHLLSSRCLATLWLVLRISVARYDRSSQL